MKTQTSTSSPDQIPFSETGIDNSFLYFKNLIQRQFPGLAGVDDLVQETLIRIWTKRQLFNPAKSSFKTWSSRICIYLCIDYLRKQKCHPILLESVTDQNDSSLLISPDTIGLLALVNTLESAEKEVIDLAYYRGFTHQEIAIYIKIPLGTVKTRMVRALKKLRKYFPEALN